MLCIDFELLVGVAMLVLLMGCLLERTLVGEGMHRTFDRVFDGLQANTELMFRAGCGFFFIAIWAVGGILLTPELKTTSTAIGLLHLGIAAGVLWRQTMPLSALGIAILFIIAVHQYGAFHLADYPVFLGVAAYLALVGMQRDLFGMRPLDVVRWAAAITLMWASIEKWAYPQWSFPLINDNPAMITGLGCGILHEGCRCDRVYPRVRTDLDAAGAPGRRDHACGAFIAAIAQFGKIDAIGHALIIVVSAGDGGRQVRRAGEKRETRCWRRPPIVSLWCSSWRSITSPTPPFSAHRSVAGRDRAGPASSSTNEIT